MSTNQLKTHPSLLDEINMLVIGNEDLNALISNVLKKRRTLPNHSRSVETGSSAERPRQILMASSTESCVAVPPDELSMSPAVAIEAVTSRLSKVILSDVEGSPLSNSFLRNTKLRAYEDSADDEASSDGSHDSLSSWLTIESSDGEDSKYPSTLDDDYYDSSFDESSENGSVYEESLRFGSPGRGKDRSGNYGLKTPDECDGESKHYNSTTESNSEIEVLKGEDKSTCSDDSSESDDKSSDSSKSDDSCDKESKARSSSAKSNSEIEDIEGENKTASSDDSSGSDEKSSDSSKTVDSSDEESKQYSNPRESNREIKGENMSASSDDSSESDEESSDSYSSKTVDSCDEESKQYRNPSDEDSNREMEGENMSASSDDSCESDEKSSDSYSSKTVDSSDEELKHYSSSTESYYSEIEGENKGDSSDDSCGKSSDSSSDSEPSINKSDGDSSDSSTSTSWTNLDYIEVDRWDESQSGNRQSSYSESGDKAWIEPRGRLSSDWEESSLIKSDDSLVCVKTGKDKLIISKKNRIGEIQSIYVFPKWGECSTSKIKSMDESTEETGGPKATPETLSSSDESEPPPNEAVETSKAGRNVHRQHKRCKHRKVDQLVERESTSSDINFLESVLAGTTLDSTSTSSLDESADNTKMSPSYRKFPSVSDDLSPSNGLNDGQSGTQSHKSNTYRKFKDVDERM